MIEISIIITFGCGEVWNKRKHEKIVSGVLKIFCILIWAVFPQIYWYIKFIGLYTYYLKKGMATHSSVLSWRIPWTEEPGGLYSPWGHKESDMTERLIQWESDGGKDYRRGSPSQWLVQSKFVEGKWIQSMVSFSSVVSPLIWSPCSQPGLLTVDHEELECNISGLPIPERN